jgi:HK97 family phage major capsid protein
VVYDTRTGFAEELRAYIFEAHAIVPAAQRRGSQWVMNLEWFNEVRRLDDRSGPMFWAALTPSAPETLLGLPIKIREDGGAPHLECYVAGP